MIPASETRSEQNWLRTFMFAFFGTSVLVISYFPLFYGHLGFSTAQVGYLYALGPLISILSNLFWSMVSDALGTVKRIILVLLAGQLSMALLLAQAESFGAVMLIISFFYFFYYPVFPLADTMAIQTAQRHGRNFITIRVFGSLGYAFFALTVGYFLSAVGSSWIMAVCIAIIGAALLFAVPVKEQRREKRPRVKRVPGTKTSGGIIEILMRREVLTFFACVFLLALGHRMNEAFLTVSLKDLGAGEDLIGWALLASALSEIPVFFALSRYADRFKELPLLAFACLMYGLRFLLMGLVQDPGAMIAVQAMHSVSFGVFYVTAIRYLSRTIPDHLRATGMAVFTVVWSSASGLLSGTFGGLIFEHAGRSVFYNVAMLFALAGCIGFLLKALFGGEDAPLSMPGGKRRQAASSPAVPDASVVPAAAEPLAPK